MKTRLCIAVQLLTLTICPMACEHRTGSPKANTDVPRIDQHVTAPEQITVPREIVLGEYFDFMDSLVAVWGPKVSYPLTEHLLVRQNNWIIDTLVHTDYYWMMAKDSFVYDQRQLVVLPKGSILTLPDSVQAISMYRMFDRTCIDINVPEFKLRILEDSILLHTFPIRVGQNKSRYLALDRRVNVLRTKLGTGRIVNHVRNPDFYNPVDGRRFHHTRRDDGRTTLMPQIPWIATEIDGIRNGQMIHPTTNPKTLGKAYSNGCIGVRESDAWVIYYHAPIGTRIRIRYDLLVTDHGRDTLHLKDIYGYGHAKAQP